jgi:hypothetical protein
MENKSILRTFIVSLIFTLLSFLPILHYIFLTYDGGLLFITNKLIYNDEYLSKPIVNWIANFSLSIFFLVLYYKCQSKSIEIVFSILFLIFSFCFISFELYENGIREMKPYFLLILIISLISSVILNLTSLIKNKKPAANNK